MTEIQKANELFNKIHSVDEPNSYPISYETAKQCAKIVVKFHIEGLENIQFNYDEDLSDDINYYKRVIQET